MLLTSWYSLKMGWLGAVFSTSPEQGLLSCLWNCRKRPQPLCHHALILIIIFTVYKLVNQCHCSWYWIWHKYKLALSQSVYSLSKSKMETKKTCFTIWVQIVVTKSCNSRLFSSLPLEAGPMICEICEAMGKKMSWKVHDFCSPSERVIGFSLDPCY